MVMHSRVPCKSPIPLKDKGYRVLIIFKKCVKVCRVIKVENYYIVHISLSYMIPKIEIQRRG